jgi:hypothetical protein
MVNPINIQQSKKLVNFIVVGKQFGSEPFDRRSFELARALASQIWA